MLAAENRKHFTKKMTYRHHMGRSNMKCFDRPSSALGKGVFAKAETCHQRESLQGFSTGRGGKENGEGGTDGLVLSCHALEKQISVQRQEELGRVLLSSQKCIHDGLVHECNKSCVMCVRRHVWAQLRVVGQGW